MQFESNCQLRQLQTYGVTTTTRLRVGLVIANCRFPIADCFNPERPIDNRQLAIGTGKTHPLPRGGTDLIGPQVVNVGTIQTASVPRIF
jgi:hypothetical protein